MTMTSRTKDGRTEGTKGDVRAQLKELIRDAGKAEYQKVREEIDAAILAAAHTEDQDLLRRTRRLAVILDCDAQRKYLGEWQWTNPAIAARLAKAFGGPVLSEGRIRFMRQEYRKKGWPKRKPVGRKPSYLRDLL